jgi:TIR domain
MPDTLVVCFTPNIQSIEGAAAVAVSAEAQRRRPDGKPGLIVYPVMTRVLQGETQRVQLATQAARAKFDALLWHIPEAERGLYWGRMAVAQEPFYGFEEVLAVFADQPGLTNTMLASMEVIAGYLLRPQQPSLAGGEQPVLRFPALEEGRRQSLLSRYVRSQPTPVRPPEMAPSPAPVAATSPKPQVVSKPDIGPYWFYISYARLDDDSYLRRFCDDLSAEIRQRTGDRNAMGFFDAYRDPLRTAGPIDLAEQWETAILRALSSTRTFVPILSSAYLASEVCGKEFQIFLKRAGRRVEVKGATGIVPVIWRPLRTTLPPVLSQIQLVGAEAPMDYPDRGLRYLLALRQRNAYERFLDGFARQLMDVAMTAQIPHISEVPSWDDVPSAFGVPSVESTPVGPENLCFVFLAPSAVRATEEAPQANAHGDPARNWKPYGRDIRLIAKAAAAEKSLFWQELPVGDGLLEALRKAQENSVAVIILVDGPGISVPDQRELLTAILKVNLANCAWVVVWPPPAMESGSNTPDTEVTLKPLASVAATVRTEEELRFTLATTIDRIQLRVISRTRILKPFAVKTPLPKLR